MYSAMLTTDIHHTKLPTYLYNYMYARKENSNNNIVNYQSIEYDRVKCDPSDASTTLRE